MFVVYTEHPIEKAQLEQQHPSSNKHFYVAPHETSTLVSLLRSILFQYFRGSPSPLAKKLTQLTVDSLNMSVSLTLFRQVLCSVKQYQQKLQLYQSYFKELSTHFTQDKESQFNNFETIEQETSTIYELINLEKTRYSKFMYSTDFQEILQKQINNRNIHSKIQKSRRTGLVDLAQHVFESTITKEKLDLSSNKILSHHYGGEDSQWWKNGNLKEVSRRDNNQSRSLSQFNYRGENVMNQGSILELMKQDAKFQKDREYNLNKQIKPQEGTLKFNKKMKQKLVTAKLKRRKRR